MKRKLLKSKRETLKQGGTPDVPRGVVGRLVPAVNTASGPCTVLSVMSVYRHSVSYKQIRETILEQTNLEKKAK